MVSHRFEGVNSLPLLFLDHPRCAIKYLSTFRFKFIGSSLPTCLPIEDFRERRRGFGSTSDVQGFSSTTSRGRLLQLGAKVKFDVLEMLQSPAHSFMLRGCLIHGERVMLLVSIVDVTRPRCFVFTDLDRLRLWLFTMLLFLSSFFTIRFAGVIRSLD